MFSARSNKRTTVTRTGLGLAGLHVAKMPLAPVQN